MSANLLRDVNQFHQGEMSGMILFTTVSAKRLARIGADKTRAPIPKGCFAATSAMGLLRLLRQNNRYVRHGLPPLPMFSLTERDRFEFWHFQSACEVGNIARSLRNQLDFESKSTALTLTQQPARKTAWEGNQRSGEQGRSCGQPTLKVEQCSDRIIG